MKPIVFILPGNELLGNQVIKEINGETGEYVLNQFPDGETYVKILSVVHKQDIIVICPLQYPDAKIIPLFFLCSLLRDLKVKSICLVLPYLAYMRQDVQFNPGEAITSKYFAKLLSGLADKLITIDPHLHRRRSLKEIYTIPSMVLHATSPVADYINEYITQPLLIGPDQESKQWVSEIAKKTDSPFIILEKKRIDNTNVKVYLPRLEQFKLHTPILIDDIISTGGSMIETATKLMNAGMKPPICIGIHAVFSGNAYENLLKAGVEAIVTCNTIPHPSNKINMASLISSYILNRKF